jgi:hypothetical protein
MQSQIICLFVETVGYALGMSRFAGPLFPPGRRLTCPPDICGPAFGKGELNLLMSAMLQRSMISVDGTIKSTKLFDWRQFSDC